MVSLFFLRAKGRVSAWLLSLPLDKVSSGSLPPVFTILTRPRYHIACQSHFRRKAEGLYSDSCLIMTFISWRRDSQWAHDYHIQSEGFFSSLYIRILWQVYCDYITHFNFRFSPVRRTLRWFILSPYHAVASDHAIPAPDEAHLGRNHGRAVWSLNTFHLSTWCGHDLKLQHGSSNIVGIEEPFRLDIHKLTRK